jgi:hypothetical protein
MDANRWYTNRGELVNVLEARLGDLLGGGTAKVISAASGTAAIEAAISCNCRARHAAAPARAAAGVHVRRNGFGG